jgi:hypothetical protein
MAPTILTDIKPGNPACTEEFFGPIALFFRAADEDAAAALANDSSFGCGGSVFTWPTSTLRPSGLILPWHERHALGSNYFPATGRLKHRDFIRCTRIPLPLKTTTAFSRLEFTISVVLEEKAFPSKAGRMNSRAEFRSAPARPAIVKMMVAPRRNL